MSDWLASIDLWDVLELLAIIFGFIYVLLEVKKTRKMWYTMIIASVFNLLVFFHEHFWAMAAIQIYYIVTAIYGIAQWTDVIEAAVEQYGEVDRKHRKEIAVVRMDRRKAIISSALACVAAVVFVLVTSGGYQQAPGDVPGKPYWDAVVAALSMLATYWLSQSYYEQWYIWVVVNVSGIVMFLYPLFSGHPENALFGMGLLYLAYLVISVTGLVNWKRNEVLIQPKKS